MNGTTEPVRPPLPPWSAVFLSFQIPGLGQFMVRRKVAGAVWFCVLVLGAVVTSWLIGSKPLEMGTAIALVVLLFLLWLAMIVHAYQAADPSVVPGANRPWAACLMSYLIPGLGQLFNRQVALGVILMLAFFGSEFLNSWLSIGASTILPIVACVLAFKHVAEMRGVEQGRLKLMITSILFGISLSVIGAFSLRTFVIQPFRVPTGAMSPTIQGIRKENGVRKDGDRLFVDKLAYQFSTPKRGDIVVFRTKGIRNLDQDKFYVKRVVGLPSETVSIKPPSLYVNGVRVTDPPIIQTIESGAGGYHGFLLPEVMTETAHLKKESELVHLGTDEYFVLGDNQPNSLDSRYWGAVPRKNIIGKVTKIYWPWERVGIVE